MNNIDDPWNFHTCKLCNYRTRFLHRILSHVRQHRTRTETHRFICDLHSPEEHKCEKCQFQSHLKVLLMKHFNTVHKAEETEHYLNSELRNCENCDFQTYSSLVLLGHKCGNGGRTGNHVLEASPTGNLQSYKCRHSLSKKSCTISSQSSPKVVDVTTNNMKHRRILRNSKQPAVSNIQHIQHPSKNKIFTVSSHSSSNHVDSDNMAANNMKPKRILRSSKKPRLSGIQDIIQHPSNKETCTISSQSISNDIDSEDKTIENVKPKRILRGSKKPKLSNIQQTQLEKLKSFECDLCPYKTVKKANLRKHILRVHSPSKNDNNRFQCKECSFKYKIERSLRRHVLSKHTQLRPFKCDHCSYSSVRTDTLKGHIYRRHTPSEQINWYICEHCSFKGKVKKDVDIHVLLKHTQFAKPEMLQRLKKCDQCSYKAIYKSGLKKHILRKHTPLTCVLLN